MKLTREKRIIALAALAGLVFGLRIVLFVEQIGELAQAIEAKPEDKQPTWLRSRAKYRPMAETREASGGCD